MGHALCKKAFQRHNRPEQSSAALVYGVSLHVHLLFMARAMFHFLPGTNSRVGVPVYTGEGTGTRTIRGMVNSSNAISALTFTYALVPMTRSLTTFCPAVQLQLYLSGVSGHSRNPIRAAHTGQPGADGIAIPVDEDAGVVVESY